MSEPAALRSAREHLARAEAAYLSAESLFHLEEGFALLADVLNDNESVHLDVARNLATTYCARIFTNVRKRVETDHTLPEPELEHLFKLMLALDQADVDLPPQARRIKIELARRLVDLYYEGYSPADKQQALERLTEITSAEPQPKAKKKK
jgi:hypothetical protein